MSNQPENEKRQNPDENPLEDFAAEMSGSLPSQSVEVSSSSVDRVEGGQVRLHQSAARRLHANALHMEESAAVYVRTGSADIVEGAVAVATAGDLSLGDTSAGILVARTVHAADVQIGFLLAQKVDGNVRPVLTPTVAAAIGAGFAATFWLLGRLFTRRR